jgi:predicted phosphodiesterase
MEVVSGRKHVKAVFYGHTHVWNQQERDGIHLINLPPVAYVFARGKPNGFCEVLVGEAGATVKLTAIDKAHADNGKVLDLKWRT